MSFGDFLKDIGELVLESLSDEIKKANCAKEKVQNMSDRDLNRTYNRTSSLTWEKAAARKELSERGYTFTNNKLDD